MRSTELYPCLPQRPMGTSDIMLTRPNTKKLGTRWLVRIGILFGIFATSTLIFASSSVGASNAEPSLYNTRQLLSTGDTNATVVDSCSTLYEVNHVPALFVTIYIILIFVLFISLAIICDDFFVPSLEAISERLELSEDVAGATFMAAGSSAPELFISIIGVSKESDVGVGTIVGSAVFNILIIIALTAALAGQVLKLDWRPLVRDCISYGISIICFIIFAWDGVIEIYEAIILLGLYVAYIVLMKLNSRIMNLSCKRCRRGQVEPIESGLGQDDMAGSSTKVVTSGDEAFTPAVQLQKHTSVHSDRKMSVISNKSIAGVPPSASNKHIFHHVKHGELAANFTSSQNDVKRQNEDDSRSGSHCGGLGSRIGSLAGSVIMEQNDDNTIQYPVGHHYGDIKRSNQAAIHENDVTSSKIVIGESLNGSQPSSPQRDIAFEVDGDAGSVGGMSAEFGSSSRLIVPSNGFNDADSGIHSAQGPTPLIPDPSDPSYVHSDLEPSALKATTRHSFSNVHHEHVVPPQDGNQPKEKVIEEDEEIEEELTLKPIPCLPAISMYYPDRTEVLQSRCGCLRLVLKWAMFIVSFPFMCAFTWTIPNCSNPKYKRLYMVSFLMSIVWIAGLSTGMVTMVERAGCILNIDHYFMGLVFVAVGTSVPDALSSILVARDGFGDMAVSNAIGSNVFDINLGLGLPFFIRILVTSSPINLLSETDEMMLASGALLMTPHAKFGFILLAILFFTLIVFCGVRFQLNKFVGVSFVMLYVAFIVYALLQEFVCKYSC
ncbi:sodium/potassium/calcium exchanger 4-like [Asterias rubens]|uniref:sodium/potassium/calcium exchanger 4-like n=1 Tax=Asterias rubens TaxID=7604 RepID=UPI001455A7B8|nr:sodium/potassium/calcium exchanger 4-like [Asterias rubens]